MSGFVASGSPYPDFTAPVCACGGKCSGNPGLGAHSAMPQYYGTLQYRGMGDLTTLPGDLSNAFSSGDFSSVLSDLNPVSSLTNILIYGAGAFVWWKFLRKGRKVFGSSTSRRRTLLTARRRAAAILADAEAAA